MSEGIRRWRQGRGAERFNFGRAIKKFAIVCGSDKWPYPVSRSIGAILRAQKLSLQAGSARVAFDVALRYPASRSAFAAGVMMSWWLRFAERSDGFGCPNPTHSDGMETRGGAERGVY